MQITWSIEKRLAAISGGVIYYSSSIFGSGNYSIDDSKEIKFFILKPTAEGWSVLFSSSDFFSFLDFYYDFFILKYYNLLKQMH